MGVKGLLGYIEYNFPRALQDVDLRRICEDYQRKHNKKPVLLLDCNVFIRNIYADLEFAYGGQWVQYLQNLRTLLDSFSNAGVDLVIMFDSVIEKKKLKRWVERRKKERVLVSKIFEEIKCTGQHPRHNLFHIPPSLSTFTRFALKHLGATVHNSKIDVDRQLYLYCREHQCLGIAGKDTDFMIYDTPYFHMSCNGGRIIRVQQFRRDILCNHLGIHPGHLPLLACLLGNDAVQYPVLARFHTWVKQRRRGSLVPYVAEFIRSLQLRDLSRETLNRVASRVSDSLGNGYLYECVQDYVYSPQGQMDAQTREKVCSPKNSDRVPSSRAEATANFVQGPQDQIDPAVLRRIETCHHELQINDFVLPCLQIRQGTSNMTLEDDSDKSMPSAALVFQPIRQRMYGILLPNLPSHSETGGASTGSPGFADPFGSVEEFCAYAGNPLDAPDVVPGIFLDISPQPRLEDLWRSPAAAAAQELRLQVFFSCMHCSDLLQGGIMESVPERYILLCCILHYLLLKAPASTLRSCDVDAFVAQAVCLKDHSPDSLRRLVVPAASPRAVHLASIFMRGLTHGCSANSTCNLPLKMDSMMPWCVFDGKLFHSKYLAAEGGEPRAQLCNGGAEDIEMSTVLRRWIVMGTRLE